MPYRSPSRQVFAKHDLIIHINQQVIALTSIKNEGISKALRARSLSADVNLHNLAAGDVAESQLKLLLDQYRDSTSLHFSLGNFYARRSRWPEAQQAYFSAFSADKDNPEYAYNLAVSLDQLGKTNAALPYYQKALILSAGRASSLSQGEVRARIRALLGNDRVR